MEQESRHHRGPNAKSNKQRKHKIKARRREVPRYQAHAHLRRTRTTQPYQAVQHTSQTGMQGFRYGRDSCVSKHWCCKGVVVNRGGS